MGLAFGFAVGLGLLVFGALPSSTRPSLRRSRPSWAFFWLWLSSPCWKAVRDAVLEPVRDYKARHASTMLTFDAVVDAIGQIEARAKQTASAGFASAALAGDFLFEVQVIENAFEQGERADHHGRRGPATRWQRPAEATTSADSSSAGPGARLERVGDRDQMAHPVLVHRPDLDRVALTIALHQPQRGVARVHRPAPQHQQFVQQVIERALGMTVVSARFGSGCGLSYVLTCSS